MAELVNMSDQFKGLPMDSLIGGPLTAACDAQVRLANATADFIKMIGFMPPEKADDEFGDTRYVNFSFERPVEGSVLLEDGKPAPPMVIKSEDVNLKVPLLAIVKVPNLSITTVDVTFDMEVKSSFTAKEESSKSAGMSGSYTLGWGILKAKVSIQGKVSSHKENTRSSDNSAKYHVSVHAEDRGMPEGLARVMDILQTSIAPSTIKPVPGSTGSASGASRQSGASGSGKAVKKGQPGNP